MTTAKIAGLNCKDTGITPELAQKLWPALGTTIHAVVALTVDEHSEDAEGALGVKLIIESIEPSADLDMAEHLRELQRAMYKARQQPSLLDPPEDSTDEVIRRGKNTILTGDDDPDGSLEYGGPYPRDPAFSDA